MAKRQNIEASESWDEQWARYLKLSPPRTRSALKNNPLSRLSREASLFGFELLRLSGEAILYFKLKIGKREALLPVFVTNELLADHAALSAIVKVVLIEEALEFAGREIDRLTKRYEAARRLARRQTKARSTKRKGK